MKSGQWLTIDSVDTIKEDNNYCFYYYDIYFNYMKLI